MKSEELRNKLTDILSAAMSGGINLTQAERSIWDLFNPALPPAEGAKKVQWSGYGELGNISQKPLQPTAEGAEAYIKSKHPQDWDEIPQWHIDELNEFATLHAQKIADKMVSERLRETTERCKKLEFMIDKGLGWKDMENDITMPHEL